MDNLISILVGIAILVIGAVVSAYVVPWLKDKHLMETVKTLVEAAEKLAESQPIEKKAWVIAQLANIGIKVTPFVEAAIESAVKQLDIAVGTAFNEAVMSLVGETPSEKE